MTKDIREAAEALTDMLGERWCSVDIRDAAHRLKAALRPSREEIAEYLQDVVGLEDIEAETIEYINYAIEELRK